jgi:peptide/nickel transport system permease protein
VTGYVVRRLAASLLLLVLVLTATFFLLRVAPGDPMTVSEDQRRMPREHREKLRQLYGLDRPLPVQYALWMGSVGRGDWGVSISQGRPVSTVIAEALPATFLLAGSALAIEYSVALLVGIAAARRRGSAFDHLTRVVSLLLFSQPVFWLGLMGILLFAYAWPILPASHMRSVDAEEMSALGRLLDLGRHLILPAAVLGLTQAGATARFVRGSLIEVLSQDFIRTARAKGLTERRVVWVHGLRAALPPLIQLFALSLPALLGGSLVTEAVFSWPGLGRLTYIAIQSRDYPVILASTAYSAAIVLLGNLLADLLLAASDPRVRAAGVGGLRA